MGIRYDSDNNKLFIDDNYNGGTDTTYERLEIVTITRDSKRVGIGGETNPSYALDAAGQVRGQDGLRVTTASGDYEIQGDGNGNLEILTPSGNRQVMFNNGDFGAFQ